MYEIIDQFNWTKEEKIITKDHHHVPGLGNFTYWNYKNAPAPAPMHYHSDILEFHCMVKGKRYSQIEKEGTLISYTYTGNEAFLTFPFEIHGNGSQPQNPCEFYAFQIITKDPSKMLGLNPEYSQELCSHLLKLKHRHFRLGGTHQQYLRTAFNFFSDMTPDSIRIGVQFLTCFLYSIQYLTPIQDSEIQPLDERIHQAILYLNRNITQPLKLGELADAAGYSLSHFKVKFKKEVGITPAEYITLQKLEYAKKELAGNNISITDLAYSLGFSSSNYFSSVFKKIMDCSPKDYRRLNARSSSAERK